MDTVPVVEFHPRGGLPNFAGNVKLAGCGRSRYPVSAHFLGQVRTPVTSPTSVWYFTGCRIRLLGKPVRPAGEKERAGDGMGVWVGPAGPAGLRVQRCDGSELPWEVGRAIGMSHVGLVDSAEGRLPMAAGRSTTPLSWQHVAEGNHPVLVSARAPWTLSPPQRASRRCMRQRSGTRRPKFALWPLQTMHGRSLAAQLVRREGKRASGCCGWMGTGLSVFSWVQPRHRGSDRRTAWFPAMPATAGDRPPTAYGLRLA